MNIKNLGISDNTCHFCANKLSLWHTVQSNLKLITRITQWHKNITKLILKNVTDIILWQRSCPCVLFPLVVDIKIGLFCVANSLQNTERKCYH